MRRFTRALGQVKKAKRFRSKVSRKRTGLGRPVGRSPVVLGNAQIPVPGKRPPRPEELWKRFKSDPGEAVKRTLKRGTGAVPAILGTAALIAAGDVFLGSFREARRRARNFGKTTTGRAFERVEENNPILIGRRRMSQKKYYKKNQKKLQDYQRKYIREKRAEERGRRWREKRNIIV